MRGLSLKGHAFIIFSLYNILGWWNLPLNLRYLQHIGKIRPAWKVVISYCQLNIQEITQKCEEVYRYQAGRMSPGPLRFNNHSETYLFIIRVNVTASRPTMPFWMPITAAHAMDILSLIWNILRGVYHISYTRFIKSTTCCTPWNNSA